MNDALEFRLSEIERRIAILFGQMQQLAVNKGKAPSGVRAHVDEIVSQYKDGKTLQEIGDKYGCSREYIRQLLASLGIKKTEGGASKRAVEKNMQKRSAVASRREARTHKTYGCSYSEALQLNAGAKLADRKSLAYAYIRKKINARRLEPNVTWTLTFPEFCTLWVASGLPRGRAKDAGCLALIDRAKGYVSGNVSVVCLSELVSDMRHKETAQGRYKKRGDDANAPL